MATANLATSQSLVNRSSESTLSISEWGMIREQASMLIKTGFLPQAITTPEKALAIILTGRELGIGTMTALNNIHVIQGKPTVSPQLMLALIHRTGEVESIEIETGVDGAQCTIKRRGHPPHTSRFGPKEAAALGLATKENYRKQAPTMYKWRAVGDCCRTTFADAILGLYLYDEMGATVDVETGAAIQEPAKIAALPAPAFQNEAHAAAFEAQAPAQVIDAELEPDVSHFEEVSEPLEMPSFDEMDATPAPEPTITKASLIKICHLTDKLEEAGCGESIWRHQLKKVTGKDSRKQLDESEVGEVLKLFAGMLNEIMGEKKKGRGK